MKTLIVDDDFTNRLILQKIISDFGQVHIAVNRNEAIEAVSSAIINNREPYDLVCLDIMMPGMDGQETLKEIRSLERETGVRIGEGTKIIMTTALSDGKNVMEAFGEACDAYIVKPIGKENLLEELRKLDLIS